MWQAHQRTHPVCVPTGYCVWHHWCETGTAPQSSALSYRWCRGSPSVWKLVAQRDRIRTWKSGEVTSAWQPCVLTWSCGRPVRLHQLHLCHLLSVFLADVVLLGHERVVERRLAHGAETVGVVVVATAASQRVAGILCWFLPGLNCCWCLKGYWKPTITEKGKGNWKQKAAKVHC